MYLKYAFTLERKKLRKMEIYNNITKRVIDDLKHDLRRHSKLKIAAASSSIYAYEALKEELEKIDELQFLFTSDLFTKEHALYNLIKGKHWLGNDMNLIRNCAN